MGNVSCCDDRAMCGTDGESSGDGDESLIGKNEAAQTNKGAGSPEEGGAKQEGSGTLAAGGESAAPKPIKSGRSGSPLKRIDMKSKSKSKSGRLSTSSASASSPKSPQRNFIATETNADADANADTDVSGGTEADLHTDSLPHEVAQQEADASAEQNEPAAAEATAPKLQLQTDELTQAETEAGKAKKKARRASNSGILMRTTTNRSNRTKARGLVHVQMSSTEDVWWEAKQTPMGQAVITTKTAPVLTPGSEKVFGAGSEVTALVDEAKREKEQRRQSLFKTGKRIAELEKRITETDKTILKYTMKTNIERDSDKGESNRVTEQRNTILLH